MPRSDGTVDDGLEEQDDEMNMTVETEAADLQAGQQNVIVLTPEEYAALRLLKAKPRRANPKARKAYADYKNFIAKQAQ